MTELIGDLDSRKPSCWSELGLQESTIAELKKNWISLDQAFDFISYLKSESPHKPELEALISNLGFDDLIIGWSEVSLPVFRYLSIRKAGVSRKALSSILGRLTDTRTILATFGKPGFSALVAICPDGVPELLSEWVDRAPYMTALEYREAVLDGVRPDEFPNPKDTMNHNKMYMLYHNTSEAFLGASKSRKPVSTIFEPKVAEIIDACKCTRAELYRFWRQNPTLSIPEIHGAVIDGMTLEQIANAPADWVKSFAS